MPNAPISGNKFKLQYTYNLTEGLKTLTATYRQITNYDYDKAGRLNQVTGSTFAGISIYAVNTRNKLVLARVWDKWIKLENWAKNLLLDENAVRAVMSSQWSNGQTEGQVNRLKPSSGKCMDEPILTS